MSRIATVENYGALYRPLHGAKWFRGHVITAHAHEVRRLIDETGAQSLLDYGCGAGDQYAVDHLEDYWGITPALYDVGVKEHSKRPVGKFDGVICCDVMEHIAEYDVEAVVDDLFNYANKFVFLVIGLLPSRAGKVLPDGRPVHLTLKPKGWWKDHIYNRAGDVRVEILWDTRERAR